MFTPRLQIDWDIFDGITVDNLLAHLPSIITACSFLIFLWLGRYIARLTLVETRRHYMAQTPQATINLTANSCFTLALLLWEIGTNCSLSFEFLVPWSSTGESIGHYLIYTLLQPPPTIEITYSIYIWILSGCCFVVNMYLFIFTRLKALPPILSPLGILLFPSYFIIRLSSAAWLGLTRGLLTVYTCGMEGSQMDADLVCWDFEHIYFYLIPASLTLVPFMLFELAIIPKFDAMTKNPRAQDEIHFDPDFTLARLLIQVTLGFCLTFAPEQIFARLIILFLCMGYLLYLHTKIIRPCSVEAIKDWRTLGYFFATWSAGCDCNCNSR